MAKKYVTGEWVVFDSNDVLTYPPPKERILVKLKAGQFAKCEFFAYAQRIAPSVIELLAYKILLHISKVEKWRAEGYKTGA